MEIFSFLLLEDYCRMDGAFLNRPQRAWFHERLQVGFHLHTSHLRPGEVFDIAKSSSHVRIRDSRAMTWVFNRRMKLETLLLPLQTLERTENYKVGDALRRLYFADLLTGLVVMDIGRSVSHFQYLREILSDNYETIRQLDLRIDGRFASIFSDEFLESSLLEKCTALQAFACSGIETEHCMQELAIGNPGLRVIVFGGRCMTLPRAVLESFANHCAALEHIDTRGMKSDAVLCLFQGSEIISRKTALLYVDLSGATTTDAVVQLVCSNNRSIRTLVLDGGVLLTNDSLLSIADLHGLVHFSLTGNCHITKMGVMELVKGCPCIESLVLRDCTPLGKETLYEIANYSRSLVAIDVAGCKGVTLPSLFRLGESCTNLRKVLYSGIARLYGGITNPDPYYPAIEWSIVIPNRPVPHSTHLFDRR